MNRAILSGRLTADPEIRYSERAEGRLTIANYTLAVDRAKDGTDFPRCTAIGKMGEFAEKYLKKGMKIIVEGHIQTGSYEKDGHKVYTTDIIVDRHEFCESKSNKTEADKAEITSAPDDFIGGIPVTISDDIPFN